MENSLVAALVSLRGKIVPFEIQTSDHLQRASKVRPIPPFPIYLLASCDLSSLLSPCVSLSLPLMLSYYLYSTHSPAY